MTIPVNSQMKWKERCTAEMNRSIDRCERLNAEAPVRTRQLTPEEFAAIFGDNPDAIKEIKI